MGVSLVQAKVLGSYQDNDSKTHIRVSVKRYRHYAKESTEVEA